MYDIFAISFIVVSRAVIFYADLRHDIDPRYLYQKSYGAVSVIPCFQLTLILIITTSILFLYNDMFDQLHLTHQLTKYKLQHLCSQYILQKLHIAKIVKVKLLYLVMIMNLASLH